MKASTGLSEKLGLLFCGISFFLCVGFFLYAFLFVIQQRDTQINGTTFPNPSFSYLPSYVPISDKIEIFPGMIRVSHRSCKHRGNELPYRHCFSSRCLNFPNAEYLTPLINEHEHQLFSELNNYALRLFEILNITYWLSGGSLIGSLRHGDLVPWDDDTDFDMPLADFIRVAGALWNDEEDFIGRKWWLDNIDRFSKEEIREIKRIRATVGHDVRQLNDNWRCGKLYHKEGSPVPRYPYKYPCIDLFAHMPFYGNSRTSKGRQFRFIHPYGNPTYASPTNAANILPLHQRPLGKFTHSVVRDFRHVFPNNILETCQSNRLYHKNETFPKMTVLMECSRLYSCYPFITKRRDVEVSKENIDQWLQDGPSLRKMMEINKGDDGWNEIWNRHIELIKIAKAFNINLNQSFVPDIASTTIPYSVAFSLLQIKQGSHMYESHIRKEDSLLKTPHPKFTESSSDKVVNNFVKFIQEKLESGPALDKTTSFTFTVEELWQDIFKLQTFILLKKTPNTLIYKVA